MSDGILLGAGMAGSAMAIDMAKNHSVTITDLNRDVLARVKQKHGDLITQQLDVTSKNELQRTIIQHDLVIIAVPGFLGFETSRAIIEAAMNSSPFLITSIPRIPSLRCQGSLIQPELVGKSIF